MGSPSTDADVALARIRLRAAAGLPIRPAEDLPDPARSALAVADRVGAPVLPVLAAVQDAHEQQRRTDRQVAMATAPARTVAVLLVALPVVVVPVLGRLLDLDLVAFYTSGPGLAVAAVAVVLWGLGAALTIGLLRHADREPTPSGPLPRSLGAALLALVVVGPWAAVLAAAVAWATHRPGPSPPHRSLATACELLATALSAGLTVAAALRESARELPELAADLSRVAWHVELGRMHAMADGAPTALVPLCRVLADGMAVGSPLAPALRDLARQVRADRGAFAEARALRLPARLTFPTSLLLLPATVLAIGAPIVASGLSAVGGS